jgi:hypothetical protein
MAVIIGDLAGYPGLSSSLRLGGSIGRLTAVLAAFDPAVTYRRNPDEPWLQVSPQTVGAKIRTIEKSEASFAI